MLYLISLSLLSYRCMISCRLTQFAMSSGLLPVFLSLFRCSGRTSKRTHVERDATPERAHIVLSRTLALGKQFYRSVRGVPERVRTFSRSDPHRACFETVSSQSTAREYIRRPMNVLQLNLYWPDRSRNYKVRNTHRGSMAEVNNVCAQYTKTFLPSIKPYLEHPNRWEIIVAASAVIGEKVLHLGSLYSRNVCTSFHALSASLSDSALY